MMKRFIIGSAFIAVFVLTGCTEKKEELQSANVPAQQTTEKEAIVNDAEEGSIVDVAKMKDLFSGFMDADYRVVIVSEGNSQQQQRGDVIIEYDAPGKTHMNAKNGNDSMETIILEESMYTRTNDESWMKIPMSAMDGVSNEDMVFTQEDLDDITTEQSIRYEGKEECSVGICDVYSTKDENTKTTMYIDVKEKRPVQMIALMSDGQKMTMTYEYMDITVKAPTENVMEIPLPGASNGMSEEDLATMLKAFEGMEQ